MRISVHAHLALATLALGFSGQVAAHASAPIAFIGDSHSVMSFGSTIAAAYPGVQRYAVGGSAAGDWLKESALQRMAAR